MKRPSSVLSHPYPPAHCRAAGLIFHAPLLREFDYYMRMDGGDSRIRGFGVASSTDPFRFFEAKGLRYGYVANSTIATELVNPLLAHFKRWRDEHPSAAWDQTTLVMYPGLGPYLLLRLPQPPGLPVPLTLPDPSSLQPLSLALTHYP